jgi:hypothetical protein
MPAITTQTKKCSNCHKVKVIKEFIRTQKGLKNPIERPFAICNYCIVISRRKKRKPKKKRTEDQKLQEKHLRANRLCQYEGCNRPKCLIGKCDSKCTIHGGAHRVFSVLYERMCQLTGSNGGGKCKALKNGKIEDIPKKEYLITLYRKQEGKCYYCAIILDVTSGDKGNMDSMSVDRVDSKIAYITSNIVLACRFCNFAKGSISVEQFKQILKMLLFYIPNAIQKMKQELQKETLTKEDFLRIFYKFHHEFPLLNLRNHDLCNAIGEFTYDDITFKKNTEFPGGWSTCHYYYHCLCIQQFRCAETGFPFCLCKTKRCPTRRSVDRMDNSIKDHYILENNHHVCFFINAGRNRSSIEQLYQGLNQRVIAYRENFGKDIEIHSKEVAIQELFNGEISKEKMDNLRYYSNGRTPLKKFYLKERNLFLLNGRAITETEFVEKVQNTNDILFREYHKRSTQHVNYVIPKWWFHMTDNVPMKSTSYFEEVSNDLASYGYVMKMETE